MFIRLFIIFYALLLHSSFAWDGIDAETKEEIEIGSGNLVREGNIIEIYDWNTGNHHSVEINSMYNSFNNVTLEVYDLELEKDRILEME